MARGFHRLPSWVTSQWCELSGDCVITAQDGVRTELLKFVFLTNDKKKTQASVLYWSAMQIGRQPLLLGSILIYVRSIEPKAWCVFNAHSSPFPGYKRYNGYGGYSFLLKETSGAPGWVWTYATPGILVYSVEPLDKVVRICSACVLLFIMSKSICISPSFCMQDAINVIKHQLII